MTAFATDLQTFRHDSPFFRCRECVPFSWKIFEFSVERLADRGPFVIRYDHRDVGRSTVYEVDSPGYTFEDMADDAVRVLDSFAIKRAHIVGMSMGG